MDHRRDVCRAPAPHDSSPSHACSGETEEWNGLECCPGNGSAPPHDPVAYSRKCTECCLYHPHCCSVAVSCAPLQGLTGLCTGLTGLMNLTGLMGLVSLAQRAAIYRQMRPVLRLIEERCMTSLLRLFWATGLVAISRGVGVDPCQNLRNLRWQWCWCWHW